MLVICQGLELSEGFLRVSKAISNKITNPILEGIKIVAEDGTLTMSATDSELSIEKKIKADVKIEGKTVVPGRFITEFVKKLTNSEIELSLSGLLSHSTATKAAYKIVIKTNAYIIHFFLYFLSINGIISIPNIIIIIPYTIMSDIIRRTAAPMAPIQINFIRQFMYKSATPLTNSVAVGISSELFFDVS